jgi:uncharacterized protein
VESLTVLIDGYNVIRRTPGLAAAERLSLDAGRQALIRLVVQHYRHSAHTAVVVFDGAGAHETREPLPRCRGRVVYTRAGESADAVIQRLAAEEASSGHGVRVFTDDMGLRAGVEAGGGNSMNVADLTSTAYAPDKYRARQARHQAYVRRQLEAGDEESHDGSARGGGRTLKQRRRGRTQQP